MNQHERSSDERGEGDERSEELLDLGLTDLFRAAGRRSPGTARYQVLEEVARGGIGVVLRGRDVDLGREIALKQLHEEHLRDPALVQRFIEEAQITGQLQHPGVVPVHELGLDGRRPFFTMKLVEGQTLAKLLADRARPLAELRRWLAVFEQVSQTVAYAHAHGVVHRDLKPLNVMVGAFGEVVVVDWGLAKVLDPSTERSEEGDSLAKDTAGRVETLRSRDGLAASLHGSVMGTPAYMPPEQATGDVARVDARADVFALGAILCEILTGSPAYLGDSGEQLAKARRADCGDWEARLSTTSADAELIALTRRCLDPERERRPRDAGVVASTIGAYLAAVEQRAQDARVSAAEERANVSAARRLTRWVTAAAACVGLGLVASLWFWRAAETQRVAADLLRGEAQDGALALAAALEEFQLLANVVELREARELAEDLYPAWPELAPRMERWLTARAEPLAARLPVLVATLDALRADARPWTDAQRARDRETHPALEQLALLQRNLDAFPGDRTALPESEQVALVEIERRVAELETIVELRRTYEFAQPAQQFLHDTLAELVADLRAFVDEDHGELASVRRRLAWAETVERDSIDARRAEWGEASAAITASPLYGGLRVAPQRGLVPLGMDPASGLWEFLHLRSGAPPQRDAATGRFVPTADSGLVFVLVPGGVFPMGAQARDAGAPNYDPRADGSEGPVADVELAPYFLSKYEMTQAQWERLAESEAPSTFRIGIRMQNGFQVLATNPVESFTLPMCLELARRHRLLVPTEAQWEYACRAGWTSPWSCGAEPECLQGRANLADRFAKRWSPSWTCEELLDDGFEAHAPVGSFEPNDWGFHDLHGNLWEWCADSFGPYGEATPRAGDGMRLHPSYRRDPVTRGGGYAHLAHAARASTRRPTAAESRFHDLGWRPARAVLP